MKDTRGFVLLNTLILVAALAAVAVLLLSRAGEGHARRLADQDTSRLRLTLDGGEALMRTSLMRDTRSLDHANDLWAQPLDNIPLRQTRLSVAPADLQGRFNVNWLSNPEDAAAHAAFYRLLERLGLPASRGSDIARFLTPDATVGVFRNRTPAVTPAGGPILMVSQLRMLPSMRDADMARLLPVIAALPTDSRLNVNTASPEVLDALLPGVPLSSWTQLVSERHRKPITSLDDFRARLGALGGFEVAGTIEEDRFSITTDWVAARLTATESADGSGRKVTRLTVFERRPLPLAPRVAYRLAEQP